MKILFLIFLLAFNTYAQESLAFNASLNQNVNHGAFWEVYTPKNPKILEKDFAWEAWVKIAPKNTLGYVVSSGYGSAHAILFGFDVSAQTGKYSFVGNFTVLPDGKCGAARQTVTFRSSNIFEPNVWYHVAIASVDHNLTAYKDGQPIISQSWTGSRISSECNIVDLSAGALYVGGSTHLNFTGEISQVRGWEGFSPYTGSAFIPETTFRSYWMSEDGIIFKSNFLAFYRPKKLLIEDLSNGYRGQKHNGFLHPTLLRTFWRKR